MNLLNTEELKRQIANGTFTGLDDITKESKKEIIGIWIGENETSKYWLTVLNDIQKRGVQYVFIFAIDGLNGFSKAISAVYPKAEIQRCIVHQIRNSLKFVSWKDRKAVAKDLKSVYTAYTEEDGQLALTEFNDIWVKNILTLLFLGQITHIIKT